MKIAFILTAILQSLWSVELGFFSFRYLVGLNLFWAFWASLAMAVIAFNLYYYCLEKFYQLLKNWPYLGGWLEKFRSAGADDRWVRRCRRWHYWGLFIAGFTPNFLLVGIAAQKIFRLKNGYWPLFFGNALKVAALALATKALEELFR